MAFLRGLIKKIPRGYQYGVIKFLFIPFKIKQAALPNKLLLKLEWAYVLFLKFGHSDKHTKFEKIFHQNLTLLSSLKFLVKDVYQMYTHFVRFSESANFQAYF